MYVACYLEHGKGPWKQFSFEEVPGASEDLEALVGVVQTRMIRLRNEHYAVGIFEKGDIISDPLVIVQTPNYPAPHTIHEGTPRIWPTQNCPNVGQPTLVVVV